MRTASAHEEHASPLGFKMSRFSGLQKTQHAQNDALWHKMCLCSFQRKCSTFKVPLLCLFEYYFHAVCHVAVCEHKLSAKFWPITAARVHGEEGFRDWPITAARAHGEGGLETDQSQQRVLTERRGLEIDQSQQWGLMERRGLETDQSQQRGLTERRGLETDSLNCFARVV